MIYSGKQIVVKLHGGEVKVFRGSAFTLHIEQYKDYGWVNVYFNGNECWNIASEKVDEIHEGGYSKERLK